jgi:CxxC motif-containing protein
MNDKREIICVICPKGCHISLAEGSPDSGGRIAPADIRGNKCKRGMTYALSEFTNPVRVLTTTVRIEGGDMPMVPVRSEKPLPKGLLMECMRTINGLTAEAPVKRGDILIKDILGTGVGIVATGNVFRGEG